MSILSFFRITKYPGTGRLSKSKVDTEIKKAFELWEAVTNLEFERRSSGSVHIEIRFEKREHGDGDPFDGPGGRPITNSRIFVQNIFLTSVLVQLFFRDFGSRLLSPVRR